MFSQVLSRGIAVADGEDDDGNALLAGAQQFVKTDSASKNDSSG